MRKSGFVLLAMGLGALGIFVACSSSNSSGGGSGGDGGASSSGGSSGGSSGSSGGSSSSSGGGYSLLNCPNAGTGFDSACVTCVNSNCSTQLASIDTACAALFNCACPTGADASACASDETQACASAVSTVATACTQCNSACGSTSSSSSSSSSSSGGASCDGGVDFTFKNVDEWCDITISGTIASSGGVATTSTAPSVSLCVQPDTTVTLTASANAGFMLPSTGFNDLLDGGTDPGTDAGGGAIQTTVAVGAAGNRCAWICCPGSGETCPTTTADCPQ